MAGTRGKVHRAVNDDLMNDIDCDDGCRSGASDLASGPTETLGGALGPMSRRAEWPLGRRLERVTALVPLLLTGVRHHPPGRTDKNLCRCFGAPARRVFPDHLITSNSLTVPLYCSPIPTQEHGCTVYLLTYLLRCPGLPGFPCDHLITYLLLVSK